MGEKEIRMDGRVLGIEGIIARADEHGTASRGERLGGLHVTIQNGGGMVHGRGVGCINHDVSIAIYMLLPWTDLLVWVCFDVF